MEQKILTEKDSLRHLSMAGDALKAAAYHLVNAGCLDIALEINPILDKMLGQLKILKNHSQEWVDIPVPAGKPRHGRKLNPLPSGPYLIADQFDSTNYEGLSLAEVMENHSDKIKSDLPETLGTVGYFFNSDRKLSKCFYFFDTSD